MHNITKIGDEARDKLISEIEEMLKGAVKRVVGDVFDINTVEKSLTELLSLVRKKVTEGIFQQIDVTHMECKVCRSKMENRGYVSRKIKGLADYEIKMRSFYCAKCGRYERPLEAFANFEWVRLATPPMNSRGGEMLSLVVFPLISIVFEGKPIKGKALDCTTAPVGRYP
ncbi:MAG: hypothetical protein HQL03_08680 [Nitrospirae bacterium]|nr:hypothetical protein [Nitrospirota bacterium]